MHHIRLGLAVFLIITLLPVCAFAKQRVGFVNPQRIINESKIGRTAQQDLARLGRVKDRRIRRSAEKINAIKAEIAKGLLSAAELVLKEKELKIEFQRHERLIAASNREIQDEENRLIRFVMRRADKLLRRIAKEQNFYMIITDPEVVGYIDPSVDITTQVIRELDSMM